MFKEEEIRPKEIVNRVSELRLEDFMKMEKWILDVLLKFLA